MSGRKLLYCTYLRPKQAFAEVDRASIGGTSVFFLGLAWSGLLLVLWQGGHQPTVHFLPISPEHYYGVQAIFMPFILLGLWWVFGQVVLILSPQNSALRSQTRGALGLAYAAGMLIHVGAELGAYTWGGFDALRTVARVSFGVAALYTWGLGALALCVIHSVAWPRAILVTFLGLLAQAIVGSPVVR